MKRIKVCHAGCILLELFCVGVIAALIYIVPGVFGKFSHENIINDPGYWITFIIVTVAALNLIFWTGIIIVYLTSEQLGIKYRVLGIVLGLVPIANVIMLLIIIGIVSDEIKFERELLKRDELRLKDEVCKTKYPILMVHGVFFRDSDILNYWGRIPDELEKNGATIYYGNHNSAAAIEDSALELEKRILEIVNETGCEKVNVIAHSKGGLDTRVAIARTSVAKHIASLTTINTPHRGCEFADYLLDIIPEATKDLVADKYNKTAALFGDVNPDFLAAVTDLTKEKCTARNEITPDNPDIYYQSVGSKLNHSVSGRFPLNFSYNLVKYFDGPNDGLVGEKSFEWGSNYQYVTVTGIRGVSHADMIDLNRENIQEFDVREFYVGLVSDLKNKGF